MFQSMRTVVVMNNMDGIGDNILSGLDGMMASAGGFVLGLLNQVLIPMVFIAIIFYMAFIIGSIVWDKNQNGGEGVKDKVSQLIIALVVLVVIGAYGMTAGGWIHFIMG